MVSKIRSCISPFLQKVLKKFLFYVLHLTPIFKILKKVILFAYNVSYSVNIVKIIQLLDKYRKIGTKDPKADGKSSLCSFNIYGNQQKNGEVYSPTYPG